jgi:hypothetical protein
MARAGQTPHGARPNREEGRGFGRGHVPARCVKPSGRSLEPRSNARPRGMAVQREQSRGQNSAYRSGCLNFFPAAYFLELPSLAQDHLRASLPHCLDPVDHLLGYVIDIVVAYPEASPGLDYPVMGLLPLCPSSDNKSIRRPN